MKIEYTPWSIGKIKGSMDRDLDKRVEELIQLRNDLDRNLQAELDFIYNTVSQREMNKVDNIEINFIPESGREYGK